MKMNAKKWVMLLAAAAILCAGAFLALRFLGPQGTRALISIDGKPYRTVDLSSVKEPYEILIETEYGSNTILVEKGAISVIEADCPDLICVHQGRLSTAGVPIVCMPHRLVIQIEGDEIDAWS